MNTEWLSKGEKEWLRQNDSTVTKGFGYIDLFIERLVAERERNAELVEALEKSLAYLNNDWRRYAIDTIDAALAKNGGKLKL